MHFFVYEFVTGGGWYSAADAGSPPASLAREGAAMAGALAADLSALHGSRVSVLRDARFTACRVDARETLVSSRREEREHFAALAAQADWTVVIAPEFQGFLAERTRWVTAAGGRLLGQPAELVELLADKHRTAEHLSQAGVPAPHGWLLGETAPLPAGVRFPAVIKPVDGAGSIGLQLLDSAADFPARRCGPLRLEPFCPGLPASVAVLCGPGVRRALPACEQRLSRDGRLAYLGGRMPLAVDLDRRARRLALQAAENLPAARGYLGIDLVLGPDAAGGDDRVIEINPRLTTSYLGLRARARGNLAAALLALFAGDDVQLSFDDQPLEFAPDDWAG